MNKIQVDILGLSINPNSQRAYALLLKEVDGPRRLPIVIGEPEAQAIANELEGVRPQRPMTHDLLRSVIETLGASVKEVVISEIKEGTFYAKIIFDYSDLEVDARPSDAIALAVRCGAPLFISEEIMDEVSLRAEDIEEVDADQAGEESDTTPAASATPQREAPTQLLTDRQRLEQELDQAIKVEDYEGAARIRDELQRLDS